MALGCGSVYVQLSATPAMAVTRGLAGILGRKLADRRRVELLATVGQQGQEPVAQKIGDRQGHPQIFGGGKGEANILLGKRRREAGRLEFPVGDQRPIIVDRRVEQSRSQDVEIPMVVDASLTDERHGFAEGFDDRGDKKVTAELDKIGGLRRL
jgi:hypothetical protein